MNQVSSRQVVLMGFCYVFSATLVTWPGQILRSAKQDAWVGVPLCSLVVLLVLWLTDRALARNPGKDLLTLLVEKFGWLGKAVLLLYVLFSLVIMAKDVRLGVDFVSVVFLPVTPAVVVGALIMATCVFMVRGGIEVIARMTELYLPVFLLFSVFCGALLVPDLSWQYLQPFFEYGMERPAVGVWYALNAIGSITILPLLFSHERFSFRQACISLVFSSLFLEFVLVICQLNLGSPLAGHLMYPAYEAVREVRVTDFLDRFDILIVGIWLPTIVIKIALNLYFTIACMRQVVPQLQAAQVAPSLGSLALVVSLWLFHTSTEVVAVDDVWPLVVMALWLGIPALGAIIVAVLSPKPSARKPKPQRAP
ncbi:GerAB/ArcD/ProY family transporter [Alicyclobacillus acidocaldarius]|uniref:Spore germination protein n=1 Tax=Alicyclobacillus acidocaldarius subsp. acidocaldarius (strain ATCC 27009 / DSM 446 / BCRC 14685 / JCM 5260 / KCTC 1825 / NBRC 15652 / NCIMB 11725 / NRRL B-14509 / 104-IA) TaxID=521098 RepID=C8WSF6_ALIAD|nr:endospore germination permease [Alicyclobacillus acidocaldarius]ACV59441.1 spore germination protein [Alicyclobacillus acidocaldarius subsp. acidocaldarius DSM 446]